MMSAAAVASGGGVAAGSLVATLLSVVGNMVGGIRGVGIKLVSAVLQVALFNAEPAGEPEEKEPSESSNQTSYGSSPGKPPKGPHQGPDDFGSDPRDPPNFYHYAVVAVRAVPELLDTVGFTRTGISRSSLAAKMMSSTARANGGGVPSGSLVSNLQSKGLTLPSSTALAGATSTLGSLVGTLKGSFLLGSPAAALSTLPVGASTVVAVPVVLGAVGFTSTGITASSLAAKMMSISAIANGGGVAAGSLVATLQSVGASGLSLSSKLLNQYSHTASRMSARAIESGEGHALGSLLLELLQEEEEEPSESSNQTSYGSSPGKPPKGPHQGQDDFGSDPRDPPNFYHYAVVAVRAVPELLDTMGFTRTGISRSSLAAKMMSSTARANGGGVPSGSLVSNLQSKGATGLSTPTNILLGSAGALLGALLWDSYSSSRRTQY
ncbi:hypothetical protein MG293_014446 [Ovis ammon polii]|uniref:Uncharacterized protein n=1 Tax=Ovis ammon polii TaxID=230172 RepID=A0AAD4U110_OVIAM|nr:hypothetical protein MG293_014446 [Ovis ammon polii]